MLGLCRENENECSELQSDTWGGWAGPSAETPCTCPATSPIIEAISCVQDWAMSKQKPCSKNKNLGSFTNRELSKQKEVFKKHDHNELLLFLSLGSCQSK